MKKKVHSRNLRKSILWHKFDLYVNMTPAEMLSFWNTEEAKNVSQDVSDTWSTGGLAGKVVTKQIYQMLIKASPYRGQFKNLPPWNEKQWTLAGNVVRYIARIFYGNGNLADDDGEETPRALAPKYWGFSFAKHKGKRLETKSQVKQDVVDEFRKEKELEKKNEKKLTESFFSNLLSI